MSERLEGLKRVELTELGLDVSEGSSLDECGPSVGIEGCFVTVTVRGDLLAVSAYQRWQVLSIPQRALPEDSLKSS